MRYRYIIFILLFSITSVIYGQNELLRLYEQNEIVKLEQRLYENLDDGNEFIQSIFMKDAVKSIEKLKNMIKNDPVNTSIPAFMERVAQYEFSVGLYLTAKEKFNFLSNQFPNSRYGEMGLYYVARCWNALGKSDSSQIVLKEFLKSHPDSKYENLILQELNSGLQITSLETEKNVVKSKPSSQEPVYTIQTGAFSTNLNAQYQQQFLEDKGIKASIYQKKVNRKKYFVVCIGEFQEKDKAESYGKNISRKYKLEEYRIVDLSQLLLSR